MGGLGNEIKALPLPWFSGLAVLLNLVEDTGTWPQGLPDAHIAMIPKADGDSTPQGQRPHSVLPVVYRLWASLWLGHLREWVEGSLPKSVFSLGDGLSLGNGLNCLNSSVFLLAHAMGRGPKWSQDQLEDAARLFEAGVGPLEMVNLRPHWPLSTVKKLHAKLKKDVPLVRDVTISFFVCGISHVCDANGVPFLSAGSLMCVTRTVLLTPSASVSI